MVRISARGFVDCGKPSQQRIFSVGTILPDTAVSHRAIDLRATGLRAISLRAISLRAISLRAIDLRAIDLNAASLRVPTLTSRRRQVLSSSPAIDRGRAFELLAEQLQSLSPFRGDWRL